MDTCRIRTPRPVEPGSRIGVFALSGPTETESLRAGVAVLESEGYRVVMAPNVGRRTGYTAGRDGERLAGLDGLLDEDVEVLWAARGGYGLLRLLPDLPLDRLKAWGGWVVGYSDVTALHAALGTGCGLACLHGPMVGTLARHHPSTRRVLSILKRPGRRRLFTLREHQVLRPGRVRGRAVGGCLSLLAALVGTAYEPDYEGAVVFIEDVGEPLRKLDRMLTQLRLSSRLASAQAVLAGRLVECGAGEPSWRERWREMLVEVAPTSAVVAEGLPFGHGVVNMAFPLGVEVEVDTGSGEVSWGGE